MQQLKHMMKEVMYLLGQLVILMITRLVHSRVGKGNFTPSLSQNRT